MTNIFLCYAKKDYLQVENLYNRLRNEGLDPWLDSKSILPGEQWEKCIQKAIRDSDFFFVCLTKNSSNRRGYIQKELKQALEIWQEMLEDDIYLIPLKIEDCEVPDGIQRFQWVNLSEKNGWNILIEAIKRGEKRRGILRPDITVNVSKKVNRNRLEILEKSLVSSSWLFSSGGVSHYYFDITSLLHDPESVKKLTQQISLRIKEVIKNRGGFDRLVFINKGSGPVGAMALMSILGIDTGISTITVRLDRGLKVDSVIPEGDLKQNHNVLIVTDVISSGSIIERAIMVLKQHIDQCNFPVVPIVLRQNIVLDNFKDLGVELYPVYGPSEIAKIMENEMYNISLNADSGNNPAAG